MTFVLMRDILDATDRVHGRYDPTTSPATRDIRRCCNGGRGLCGGPEPLFAQGSTTVPTH
jgi:hypothetical protein